MRLKRAILLAAAALIAGAVVNVGVAWWFAYQRPVFYSAGQGTEPSKWPVAVPPSWPMPNFPERRERASAGVRKRSAMHWSTTDSSELWRTVSVEFGWPLGSLMLASRGHTLLNGAIEDLAPKSWSGVQVQRGFEWTMQFGSLSNVVSLKGPALPLIPLWPGFLINTLFYAAIVSAPFALFGAVRHWRRRAHFQCPKCAYDLRGLAPGAPCPECGAKAESPRV